MALYVVFGVGVGNIGRGHGPRRSMPMWIEFLDRYLRHGEPRVKIISFFGHTGNFLAESPSTDLDKVTARFKDLLDIFWVVRPLADVHTALTAIAEVPQPATESGIRWTPGLAFHGGACIPSGRVETIPQAVLWMIAPHTVGAWKRDVLNGRTLDRDRRGGGWGKISWAIQGQLGGQWTARSCRTINGLIRKSTIAKVASGS